VRSFDRMSTGSRLLVRGLAAHTHARRAGGMSLPELSASENRGVAEIRQDATSVKR